MPTRMTLFLTYRHISPVEAPTYAIRGSNGLSSTLELVECDGKMMPVLYEDTSVFVAPEDDN